MALGAAILDPAARTTVLSTLTAGHYYRPLHGVIHTAIADMAAAGQPVDAVTVRAALAGELDHAGQPAYLHTLISAVPTAAHAGHYTQIVAECATRRQLHEIGGRLTGQAVDSTADGLPELCADLGARLLAAADTTAGLRPNRLRDRLLDTDGLDGLPDPEPLVGGLLYTDSLAWLYGQPGSGKSLLALDWAGCVATGKDWQGHPVKPGPVLYVAAEGVRGLGKRKRAWETAWRTRMGGVAFLPVAVQLLDAAELGDLVGLVDELQPALIVVDTQARMTVGVDENSNGDVGLYVAAADRLRQVCGSCVLTVHHSRKDGESLRGASAVGGAGDTVLKLCRDGDRIDLANEKQKDDERHPTVALRIQPINGSCIIESHSHVGLDLATADSERRVLATMRDNFGTIGARGSDLRDASGLPRTTFYRALNVLVSAGALVNVGTDRAPFYRLPGQAQQ